MTEKNYNPEQKQRKSMKKQEKFQKAVDTEAFKSEKSEIVEDKDKKIEEKVEASGEVEKKQEKKIKEKPKKQNQSLMGLMSLFQQSNLQLFAGL